MASRAILAAVRNTPFQNGCKRLPRIYIVRARLLQHMAHDHAAEASLRTAIEVAESQNAKGSQLCAATSLASVWRDHGRREEARDLLAPIFNWFTDRSDSPDFRYAEALLNELS